MLNLPLTGKIKIPNTNFKRYFNIIPLFFPSLMQTTVNTRTSFPILSILTHSWTDTSNFRLQPTLAAPRSQNTEKCEDTSLQHQLGAIHTKVIVWTVGRKRLRLIMKAKLHFPFITFNSNAVFVAKMQWSASRFDCCLKRENLWWCETVN